MAIRNLVSSSGDDHTKNEISLIDDKKMNNLTNRSLTEIEESKTNVGVPPLVSFKEIHHNPDCATITKYIDLKDIVLELIGSRTIIGPEGTPTPVPTDSNGRYTYNMGNTTWHLQI